MWISVLVLPRFADRAERIVSDVCSTERENDGQIDANNCIDEMIDACKLIHDGVNGIRHALLMNHNPEDIDSDNEYEEGNSAYKNSIHNHVFLDAGTTMIADSTDVRSQVSEYDNENQQRIMRQLPEESKREIQKQIDVFKVCF